MYTSLFDLFKIGIGPSSSHTVGPMRAGCWFVEDLSRQNLLERTHRVRVELYGSLALTGKGHGTDRAVLLGLCGEKPDSTDPETVDARLDAIRGDRALPLFGTRTIAFDEARDLVFFYDRVMPKHSNGMRFLAFDDAGTELLARGYYSIGGGFVVGEQDSPEASASSGGTIVPYPFNSAAELLDHGRIHGMPIHDIVMANECALRSEREVRAGIERIWNVMRACIERGLRTEGILPGGLNVRRRAPKLFRRLTADGSRDPLTVMDAINVYAMAVNEENAAGGRVVTAPTNGAAGIIPAVLHYYETFVPNAEPEGIVRFFLTASAIGALYKENASISGAEVGCQGEVGVACSMAAGGLVAALDGTNDQIEEAAEIGMEHHLGMTCDPIGGLVQIPCIERNALGAVKAINAARMAMHNEGDHKVSLDQVIKTMYETGLDMQSRYKETSQGGLAVNVIEC